MLAPVLGLMLALAPYDGPPIAGSQPGTAKFRVAVAGRPGQSVTLRAVGVPPGYIASFCTNRVCAPFHVSLTLPRTGTERIELALIENAPGAMKPRTVRVLANGGVAATIAFARAAH